MSLLTRLKERKLVQWALAYIAGAWVVLQVMDVLAEPLSLSAPFQLGVVVVVTAGFFVTLVLAWYHGEKGSQHVGGMELLLIAAVLAVAGFGLSRLPETGLDDDPSLAEASFAPSVSLRAFLIDNPAVAILPLENLGSDEDQYFADGVHEDILISLQKLSGLTVIARQAVEPYAESDIPLRQVAADLDVDAVGLGSVRRAGERFLVTIQLVEPESSSQLWAERYDLDVSAEGLFDLQERVARSVAAALQAALTPEENDRLAHRSIPDPRAFELVQLGEKEAQAAGSAPGMRDAREPRLRQALAVDSTYAEAWARLSEVLAQRVSNDGWPIEWADTARAMANRALELDPYQWLGYTGLALVAWAEGREELGRAAISQALELQPGNARLLDALGVFSDNHVDAVALWRRALRADPSRVNAMNNLGEAYAILGLDDLAESQLNERLARNPRSRGGLHWLSYLRALQGRYDEALTLAERTANIASEPGRHQWVSRAATWAGRHGLARDHAEIAYRLAPESALRGFNVYSARTTLAFALQLTGEPDEAAPRLAEAQDQLEDLLARGSAHREIYWEMACIKAQMGAIEEAVQWAQRAYDQGFRYVRAAEIDPILDPLRGHPEFERIMTQMRADVDRMREEVLAMEAELEAARAAAGR